MLEILLMILKIAGWILLGILGLALFLLLLVLFVPVPYRVRAEYGEALAFQVRVFGIRILPRKEKKGKKRRQKKRKAADGEAAQEEAVGDGTARMEKAGDGGEAAKEKAGGDGTAAKEEAGYDGTTAQMEEAGDDGTAARMEEAGDGGTAAKEKAGGKTEAAEPEAERVKPQSAGKPEAAEEPGGKEKPDRKRKAKKRDKKKKKPEKKRDKSRHGKSKERGEKARSLRDQWNALRTELTDEGNRRALLHALREVRYLLKHCGPRRVKADAAFSLGDPANTGYAAAAISLCPFVYGKGCSIIPDFESESFYFKGWADVGGHVRAIHFLCAGLRLLLDGDIRKIIHRIRK